MTKKVPNRKGSIGFKAEYVRQQAKKGTGDHHCHWPGCTELVAPALWGCRKHWYQLPISLRSRIWKAYRPGQEIAKNPSEEYLEVAKDVQEWIEINKDDCK